MMAIRKASEVAEWDLWPAWDARETAEQGYAAMAAKLTADRLAIVARLREMARGPMATSMATTQDMFDIARILESEIKAAAASKGTNDE